MFISIGKKLILILVLLTAVLAPLGHTTQAQSLTASSEQELEDVTALPACLTLTEGSVIGCMGQLLYWAGWWPTQFMAARAGGFLDYFIFYSINSSTYRGVPFDDVDGTTTNYIQEGWEVVRDITNILFVFALLYIGISFVIGAAMSSADPKKLLIYVIVMALIINFSLFVSRVVVDAGNILARTLYNQINLVGRNNSESFIEGPDGVKSIGLMIISLANPQKLILSQTNQAQVVDGDTQSLGAMYFVIVTIGAIIFNLFLIYLFVSIAFYFLGRIVSLYYSMIFSPFAFVSLAIPKGSSIPWIGFSAWLKNLLGASFMAPLYLFFIYLTIKFLELGIPINPNVSGGNQTAQVFMSIAIPFALAIAFLVVGKKMSARMAGEVAGTVAKGVTTAVVTSVGLAAGGAALVGRGAMAGGSRLLAGNAEALKKRAATGTRRMNLFGREINLDGMERKVARARLRGADKLKKRGADIRNNSAFKAGQNIMGLVANATGEKMNTSTAFGTRLKYNSADEVQKAREKKRREELERDVQLMSIDGLEAQRRDEAARLWNANLDPEASREYERALATAQAEFQRSLAYTSLTSEHERQQAMAAWRDSFDTDYEQGVVQTQYDDNGNALNGVDEDSVRDNRLAAAITNLENNPAFQAASQADQARLLTDLEAQFNAYYSRATNPVTFTESNVTNTGGVLSLGAPANLRSVYEADGWNDQVRVRRQRQLEQELENSAWWATAAQPARDMRQLQLQREFHTAYERGEVVTEVDAATGRAVTTGASVRTLDQQDAAAEHFDPRAYRRMETSAQINARRKNQYSAEQLRNAENMDDPYLNRSRRRATESYARENLVTNQSDERKLGRTRNLEQQLQGLNETLATWIDLSENPNNRFTQGGAAVNFETLDLNAAFEFNGQNYTNFDQFTRDYSPAAGETTVMNKRLDRPEELARNTRAINGATANIEARIAELENQNLQVANGTVPAGTYNVANNARQISLLRGIQGQIRNGISQRTQLNNSIRASRG